MEINHRREAVEVAAISETLVGILAARAGGEPDPEEEALLQGARETLDRITFELRASGYWGEQVRSPDEASAIARLAVALGEARHAWERAEDLIVQEEP